MGGGWKAEGELYHPLKQEFNRVVVSSMKIQPQCTCQAKTIVGSILTPHAALLALPTPCSDRHEFTGSEKCCL